MAVKVMAVSGVMVTMGGSVCKEILEAAEREARILQQLRHPNIVAFYGTG